MQKLLGNNLDKFNKSCSTFHQESNKIKFAFFRIFYYFLYILQDSAKTNYYLRFGFSARPLEDSGAHNHALALRLGPYKDSKPCNVALRAVAGAARVIPVRSAALAGQGRALGGLGVS
jgi:hypothetical protein